MGDAGVDLIASAIYIGGGVVTTTMDSNNSNNEEEFDVSATTTSMTKSMDDDYYFGNVTTSMVMNVEYDDHDNTDGDIAMEMTTAVAVVVDPPQCKLDNESSSVGHGEEHCDRQRRLRRRYRHHPSLKILDLGFNNIGDEGCTSLSKYAASCNPTLSTLYLSGNAVGEAGALALSNVIGLGCGLLSLHLTANRIGPIGVKELMKSMTEFDVAMQQSHQEKRADTNVIVDKKGHKRITSCCSGDDVNDDVNDDVDLESLGINDDENNTGNKINHPNDTTRLHDFQCMEELYLGGTYMGSVGCLSVSNMLLTNLTLRVICLSDNGLNDKDLSLLSQSLSRNRELPLEILRLSFNKISCLGVETLMNAIWGSKTLREIKLDNNQIKDRGAQLAAVVMTSVDLEVLDMGFNRLTIVGIKALMKRLAENRTLLTMTLSGNVLDTNASKAVSYALAYNKTIQKIYIDHCSLSYAAQRHIAAGIVSNSNLALRVMSGFLLGAISVTLGLPGAMETWSNEQVLKFIRLMWDRHRHENECAALLKSNDSTQSMFTTASKASMSNSTSEQPIENGVTTEPKSGPSDPATVVAAAKSAFQALGDAGGALLLTEESQRAVPDSSPMVSSDAVMLEKTPSGTIRVPLLDGLEDEIHCRIPSNVQLEASTAHLSSESLLCMTGKESPETAVDPVVKRRNLEFLRLHYRSLNEMARLPYVHADLLQLHRYFYAPLEPNTDDECDISVHSGILGPPKQKGGFRGGEGGGGNGVASVTCSTSSSPSPSPQLKQLALQRKSSYRGLHEIMTGQSKSSILPTLNFGITIENSCKRPLGESKQPATKRAKSDKPRIDYYLRLKVRHLYSCFILLCMFAD